MECQEFTLNLARYITDYLTYRYVFETGKIARIIVLLFCIRV